uniref:Uncharacterized protein LOC111128040 isoform X1 n=1 Tax=Crassostrea virginica TaxID=6565 RepID=A0A8B8DNH5_CRAVI|nr:uncharacterized protein LOC111128040 isoform X1 [Crassostrea virginica]XP_022329140.1 uncharacterized protein LOC111128040 isoform X1 [Crassostrea virginica]XP_022329141.1 uncharacterized protein LOC111128040 isoform X1 [Crassostrea virginica]
MSAGEKDRILTSSPTKTPPFLRNITIIARLSTMATLAVMWAAAVYVVQDKERQTQYVGFYLIAASVVVTFFELTWVINKSACCRSVITSDHGTPFPFRQEGCCCFCWQIVMWVDNWKKGIFYLLLSVPVFLEGMRIILGMVSGFLLIVCGLLYILKTFKDGIVYTVTETQYIPTTTPVIKVITHEISTQTEDKHYYREISGH